MFVYLRKAMDWLSENTGEDSGSSPFEMEDWGEISVWRFGLAPRGVNVYFTNRKGGLSRPPYDSLNLGFHVGDDPEAVIANRNIIASTLGVDPARITSPRQRHTEMVSLLDDIHQAGAGATGEASLFDPCDGLVTDLENVPILLHFADCVPVVLAATAGGGPVAGVVHAGREGLMKGVLGNAVKLKKEKKGVAPEMITAAIGPCIGQCCYEVDEETAAGFAGKFGGQRVQGRFLDLGGAAEDELAAAGLPRAQIHQLDLCTSCDGNFFSYRRDGITGRHGAIAWIGGGGPAWRPAP